VLPGRTHALNLGVGEFHGAGAMAVSYSQVIHRSEDDSWEATVNVGLGTDFDMEEVGGRVGLGFQW